jgi:hypothetical protein
VPRRAQLSTPSFEGSDRAQDPAAAVLEAPPAPRNVSAMSIQRLAAGLAGGQAPFIHNVKEHRQICFKVTTDSPRYIDSPIVRYRTS